MEFVLLGWLVGRPLARRSKAMDKNDEQSPIPIVCQEESRLQAAMEETRAQAQRLVEQARDGAARRIEDAERRMPELMRDAGGGRRREIAAEAQKLRDACRSEAAALESAAGANLQAAVAFIVSLVVPEPD